MSFTHLQVRSGYSLLTSTISIPKLVKKAKALGFQSLALTDEAVLYGAIAFYKACREKGIKPIIGMVVDIVYEQEPMSCILLAKNTEGYYQLVKLSSYIQSCESKRIAFKQMKHYATHLKCILPIHHSPLQNLLEKQLFEQVNTYVEQWKQIFSNDDVYLSVQDHGQRSEQVLNEKAKLFQASFQDVSIVALNDVRYLEKRDSIAYDCLKAIHGGQQWTFQGLSTSIKNRYVRPPSEMIDIFSDWPQVIETATALAEECSIQLELNQQLLPSYPLADSTDAATYLEKICLENANHIFRPMRQEVHDRLLHELQTVQSMGFSDYFLIVADFVQYAKAKGISVGPGRGSAAGSLIAYVLGITEINPLSYGLLFERFLNPERVSMPDIDIDFSDYRRDEVIQYVREKYGPDHVAQITTFGTYAARSIVRELIKTMNINEQDAAFILRHVPVQATKSLKDYINESEQLKTYIKQSNELRMLFTIAIILEGLPRHVSTHAAGLVITEKPLTHYVPIMPGSNETNITQYAMNDLETIGLLKIDMLGLKNLTLLEHITRSIQMKEKKEVDLSAISMEDAQTFKLLQLGRTNGVFQFESRGMKQVLQRLKPDVFEDLVAVNALYRPGPMDFIMTYIKRKHKQEPITYLHPDLEPILKKTNGVLIYQEQIMLIAHKVAGFSYGQADILRRAISKKQKDVMEHQREVFIGGCIKKGYAQEVATQIFSWILKFSDYGFNRSHAVSYSKISYQLAYLKAHYPIHFFTELLSASINQQEKVQLYIKELNEMNIAVKPPSINYSYAKFSVEQKGVRIGLSLIKGIGNQIIQAIIRERKQRHFKSLFDFCLRISPKVVNRTSIELLIRAGAFDEIYTNRASLLASIDQAMERGELFGDFNNQRSLFEEEGDLEAEYIDIADFSQTKKLQDEKELLGIYVSSHPLAMYRHHMEQNGYVSMQQAKQYVNKRKIKTIVIIQSIKVIRTKRGDRMAFLTISDETDEMEAVVFPEIFREVQHNIEDGMEVELSGKIINRNNKIQWVVDDVALFHSSALIKRNESQLFIKIIDQDSASFFQLMKQLVAQHPGTTPIIVYHKKYNKTYQLEEQFRISPNEHVITRLKQEIGEKNVVLKVHIAES